MKIAINTDAWTANPKVEAFVGVPAEGPEVYRFILPARSEVITALVVDNGEKIDLQDGRSASHRALRDALQG